MVAVNCAYDQMVPLHKLVPNPRNPNTHPEEQLRLLAKIIDYQGWRNPIVVSTLSGFIVKGHARLTVAERLQLDEVPVDYQDYENEAQEWADLLADNRIAELAETERTVLKDLLEELDTGAMDMELTGYTDTVIEDLMTELHSPTEGLTDDDAVPEATESICRRGDLWQLGNHRLLCGDATIQADVERLMGGEKADMVFTDPPYGNLKITNARGEVGKSNVAKTTQYHKYANEGEFDFRPCWNIIGQWDCSKVIWGGNYFVNVLPITTSWIVWDKRAGNHSWYSDCELAWTNLGIPAKIYSIIWQGMIREGETDKRVHPTQKPIELAAKIIDGQTILDLFGGSGSTLIACEKLGRRCYMMEIDEHYCDVIIARYEAFTGQKAMLLDK